MAKSSKRSNLGLAGIFIFFVLGLILLSLLVRTIFIVKETKFDGKHAFDIEVSSKNSTQIISLSPPTRSISILTITGSRDNNLSQKLDVPVDATIFASDLVNKDNLSTAFLKLILPFGNYYKNMNYIDALRIFIFSKGISSGSIYERSLSEFLNQQQKSTVIALTFIDPTIYEENKSIEIVNSTQTYGLGAKLANLVTNIGGNVILITSPQTISKKSEIVYFGGESYTIERLSKILEFPVVKTDKKSISDVIIIIGEDNKSKF